MTVVEGRRTQAERTAATRARLMEAAFDCLAEVGYARTTTSEVASRAGISRGAALHHFPTKVDLVLGAHEHVLERRRAEFVDAFSALTDPTVPAAIDLLWRMYQGPSFAAWLELAVAARTDAELHDRFVQMERRYATEIAETFTQLFPEAPDPDFSTLTVNFAFAVLDSLAMYRALGWDNDGDRIVDLLKSLAELFAPSIRGGTT